MRSRIPTVTDRRSVPRGHVTPGGAVVRVKFQNKRQLKQTWIKDISKGGIFLRTLTPLEPFEKVMVVLELPDGEEVELNGIVVHVVTPADAGEGAAGMGVQFQDLTQEKRARVDAFLQRHRTVVPTSGAPPALETIAQALRRVVWSAADPAALLEADHYQLLGVRPDAPIEIIRERIGILKILVDPASLPEGIETPDGDRIHQLGLALAEIEAVLTNPLRREEYDAVRRLVLR
jgi:uncharacterized protein (TIGR02266 family)